MGKSFRTHTGEVGKGERLEAAFNKVADDWANNAKAIKEEDDYASHVTEKQKEDALIKGLEYAELIRRGKVDNFTIWQRLDTFLTGECIALLP